MYLLKVFYYILFTRCIVVGANWSFETCKGNCANFSWLSSLLCYYRYYILQTIIIELNLWTHIHMDRLAYTCTLCNLLFAWRWGCVSSFLYKTSHSMRIYKITWWDALTCDSQTYKILVWNLLTILLSVDPSSVTVNFILLIFNFKVYMCNMQ